MASFSQSITVSADDGRRFSNGSFSTTAISYNLGQVSLLFQGGFFRFQLNGVPKDTVITNANIEFEAETTQSDDVCRSRITADQADDAAAPTTGGEFITQRQNHGTELAWLPPDQPAGDTIRTDADVNMDVVIQEIVDRAGWVAGNHIVLFVDDTELEESDAEAKRGLAFEDEPSRAAPILSFNYTSDEEETEFITVVNHNIIIPRRTVMM